MINNKKLYWVLMVVSMISFLGLVAAYPSLPETVPTHWGFNGEIDGYSAKSTLLFMGLVPMICTLLFVIVPKMDPKKENYAKHSKAYSVMCAFTVGFMILVTWMSVAAAMGYDIEVSMLVPIVIGVLFIVLGNYMPQIRQNYSFGIKTPWAIDNEYVWRKTHKFGGIVFCIMGIALVVFPFLPLSESFGMPFILGVIIGGTVLTYIYSWLVFKNQKQENK